MRRGLLGGELASTDQLLDERMVVREPHQLAVPKVVGAAVTDVRDREIGLVQIHRGQRRTHPLVLEPPVGGFVDPPVGGLHPLTQSLLGRALRGQPT